MCFYQGLDPLRVGVDMIHRLEDCGKTPAIPANFQNGAWDELLIGPFFICFRMDCFKEYGIVFRDCNHAKRVLVGQGFRFAWFRESAG